LGRERDTTASEEAFAALVRRQSRFAFQVAHAVLRNAQDAEDVVQDCFPKLYRAKSWRQVENERAFPARVVWRHAVGRRPRVAVELSGGEPVAEANPEQLAVSEDLKQLTHRLIDTLPGRAAGAAGAICTRGVEFGRDRSGPWLACCHREKPFDASPAGSESSTAACESKQVDLGCTAARCVFDRTVVLVPRRVDQPSPTTPQVITRAARPLAPEPGPPPRIQKVLVKHRRPKRESLPKQEQFPTPSRLTEEER
jgi:Sigma-70 region 2